MQTVSEQDGIRFPEPYKVTKESLRRAGLGHLLQEVPNELTVTGDYTLTETRQGYRPQVQNRLQEKANWFAGHCMEWCPDLSVCHVLAMFDDQHSTLTLFHLKGQADEIHEGLKMHFSYRTIYIWSGPLAELMQDAVQHEHRLWEVS